jgi:hypothetical protein
MRTRILPLAIGVGVFSSTALAQGKLDHLLCSVHTDGSGLGRPAGATDGTATDLGGAAHQRPGTAGDHFAVQRPALATRPRSAPSTRVATSPTDLYNHSIFHNFYSYTLENVLVLCANLWVVFWCIAP